MQTQNLKQKGSQSAGIWLMLASSILFATGGLVLKWINWNPLAINGVRSLFGACTIGLYLVITHHKPVWNRTVALGAVSYMCMTTLFVVANKMTSAANAIVLQYSCPIWILLINWIFYHKKPERSSLMSLVMIMAGIVCFFFSSIKTGGVAGDISALVSGLFYAVLFMINSMKGGDAISSVFFGMCISFIMLSPFSLYEGSWTFGNLLVLVYLGVFQVGFAYIFFSLSTRRIPPFQASLINGVEPVLNPLLVALFWHEGLSWLQLAGAFIVISSVLYDSLRKMKKTAA